MRSRRSCPHCLVKRKPAGEGVLNSYEYCRIGVPKLVEAENRALLVGAENEMCYNPSLPLGKSCIFESLNKIETKSNILQKKQEKFHIPLAFFCMYGIIAI